MHIYTYMYMTVGQAMEPTRFGLCAILYCVVLYMYIYTYTHRYLQPEAYVEIVCASVTRADERVETGLPSTCAHVRLSTTALR